MSLAIEVEATLIGRDAVAYQIYVTVSGSTVTVFKTRLSLDQKTILDNDYTQGKPTISPGTYSEGNPLFVMPFLVSLNPFGHVFKVEMWWGTGDVSTDIAQSQVKIYGFYDRAVTVGIVGFGIIGVLGLTLLLRQRKKASVPAYYRGKPPLVIRVTRKS